MQPRGFFFFEFYGTYAGGSVKNKIISKFSELLKLWETNLNRI